jgi:hypothetical protein
MYVSDFWCGVIATLGTEFIILLIAAIRRTYGKRKGAR